MKTVYFVSGDKGGCGKSWVSASLVHTLLEKGLKIHIVETDTGNPDVYAPYCVENQQIQNVTGVGISLDDDDGWISLIDVVEEQSDETAIVVNHGARGNRGAIEHGAVFFDNLQEIGVDLKIIWVLNAEKDGVVSLKNFKKICGNAHIYVVMNSFFGPAAKFEVFMSSDLRKEILASGGNECFFPVLPERVASRMRNERKHFRCLNEMPISNRLASKTFLQQVAERFQAAGV